MKHSPSPHALQTKIAKKFANEHDIYGIRFVCYWYNCCIFGLVHEPNCLIDAKYPPEFIVVDQQNVARFATEEEAISIFESFDGTNYPWGKAIFDEYERTWEGDAYKSEIVHACMNNGFEAPIKKEVMYKALELAEFLGKKVYIEPDPQFLPGGGCEGQCDGWTYHPEVR